MIIKPTPADMATAALFAAGGPFEPTQQNFPALRHRFARDCLTGFVSGTDYTSMTDSVGGVVVTCNKGYTAVDANTFSRGGSLSGAFSLSKAFDVAGDTSPIVLATGSFAATLKSICIVSNPAAGVGMYVGAADATLGYVVINATDYATIATPTSITGTQTFWGTAAVNAPVDGRCFNFSGNASAFYTAAGTVTHPNNGLNDTWPAFPHELVGNEVNFAIPLTVNYTGIYLLYFEEYPGDALLQAGAKWMGANPGKVFPGFAGLR